MDEPTDTQWLHDSLAGELSRRVPDAVLTGWVTVGSILTPSGELKWTLSGCPGGTPLRTHEARGLLLEALFPTGRQL